MGTDSLSADASVPLLKTMASSVATTDSGKREL
jgi:hypothetical protein